MLTLLESIKADVKSLWLRIDMQVQVLKKAPYRFDVNDCHIVTILLFDVVKT